MHKSTPRILSRSISLALLGAGIWSIAGPTMASAIEEVIVSARKTEENVQQVPTAITALTQQDLSDLKIVNLGDYWKANPLMRILCEQPAIWTVPLAISLMIVVSKLTASKVPADIRMKMLVLHAPEKLGLKQEYIQEHQAGAGH